VVADDGSAPFVFDEETEDLLDRLVGGGECKSGFAHDQFEADLAGQAVAARDPMADGAALHRDDLLQPIAAVGGGGEAKEVAGGRGSGGSLGGGGREGVGGGGP